MVKYSTIYLFEKSEHVLACVYQHLLDSRHHEHIPSQRGD